MQNEREQPRRNEGGYALMVTLLFLAIMLVFLASAIQWTSTSTALTSRHNLFTSGTYAAEAATEQVLARMDYDFVNQSLSPTLSTYGALIPAQADWPIQYEFGNGSGAVNRTGIRALGIQVQTNLSSPFAGLYGVVNIYQATSTARPINRRFDPEATVSQQFQLALIPVFQFAIFYNLDLEINPGAPMAVTGKVHGNGQIYTAPPASLVFRDNVTAVGLVHNDRSTNDPTGGSKTMPIFSVGYLEKVGSLTLPIGASDNRPGSTVQILDPPPTGEDPTSPAGKARLYNSALLIVSNSASGNITVTAGQWDSFANLIPDVTNAVTGVKSYSFVTNTTFYDYRERKQVQATQIDVGKLGTWIKKGGVSGGSGLNTLAQVNFNHDLNSVYVLNQQSSIGLPAVRVVNGAKLPDSGLTVATPHPLYVQGNFNLNNGDTTAGLTNTSQTLPASLMGDSVSILSGSWKDSYIAATGLSSRTAANTTVNAAILTGIVASTRDASGNLHYSGGVENLPRLLENWGGNTLTYNGSMVVMFPSRYATNFWIAPGTYYGAPTRKWAFDMNFLAPNRLPPLAPSVRKLFREQWQIVASTGS